MLSFVVVVVQPIDSDAIPMNQYLHYRKEPKEEPPSLRSEVDLQLTFSRYERLRLIEM